jgi:hypothetical protein
MAVPENLTEALDNLYTTTWKHIKSTAADNIFDSTPLLAWMRRRGRIQDQVGGRHIEEPVIYAKNTRVGWATRGSTVDMSDEEFLTETKWDWKYLYAPVVRFGTDDHKNRGKMQIMNYADAKLENARTSLEDTLETTLFAGQAAGDEFDGLQWLVDDDPTSAGTIGNIDQVADSFWRNKTNDMTGVSFATSGVDRMRTMFNDVGQNKKMDMTDIIVTGQTVYEYYEDAILGKFQFENKELTDLGFTSQTFKQKPMIWSPACGTRMYFLNTKYLRLVRDPGLFMDMTPWKAIPNQINDRAAQIISALTLTTNQRRVQGVIHTIDTA